MEKRFDTALQAVERLSAALDEYIAVQGDIAELERYYHSSEWRKDFAADEAGLLPADMKRGVLSEDGIWNLLDDNRELIRMMRERGESQS